MKSLFSLGVLLVNFVACAITLAGEWTDNSFQAFRNGQFLDGGSNLYVSASGKMQIINRWDLNGDGFLDIVIPSGHTHTEKEDTFIYLNSGQDIDGHSLIKLPANGSRDGLICDFNKDGLNDIAVCNGDNGITPRTDAYVYFGTQNGFTVDRRITLPAHASSSITAGDFNGDGWTDLAIASQWQDGDLRAPVGPKQSFVYWNSAQGFDPAHRTPFNFDGVGAVAVAAGDLDRDGIADVIMMTGKTTFIAYGKDRAIENTAKRFELPFPATAAAVGDVDGDAIPDLALCAANEVIVIRGSASAFKPDQSIRLAAISPRDVAISDLDGDGLGDVIVANHATREGAMWINSYVYWSDGKQFSTRPRTELPTMGASSISAGDLNGDGKPELVFGNERVLNQGSIPSLVYWNDAGQFRIERRTELETQGCVSNAIGDVNNDGKPDVIFFNYEGNFRDGPSSTHIYWGDGTRNFSPLRRTEIDTHYITSIAHADLNDDGYVDLVLTQGRFISQLPDTLFNSLIICWNSADGFTSRTRLTVDDMAGGVRVADLNRDGFLDLIVGAGCTEQKSGVARKGIPIFWGSKQGFAQQNRTIIAPVTEYPRVPLIADLNRDGILDLANQTRFGTFTIWWGKGDGTFREPTTEIDLGRADQLVFINSADLNKDGWPDLILPCRKVGYDNEVSSFIYFGSQEGFSSSRREELASTGIYETAVADLDRDGWLDLVFTSYQGNFKRNFPSPIYWGSEHGFRQRPRTELPTYAASGVETADYDGDGFCDILFSNHRIDGSTDAPGPHNHKTSSMLYWGGKDGFSPQRRWDFSTNGPHAMNVRDVGNGVDRGLYEDYISQPHELPESAQVTKLVWLAQTPQKTAVKFQLRAAENRDDLNNVPWRGPNDAQSWYDTSGAAVSQLQGRWIQYRARLSTPNGGPTPFLTSVTITFDLSK